MSRRLIANAISTLVALGAGGAAFVGYYRYLTPPQRLLDWIVDLAAGLTIGIIFFFLAWGHFQQVPSQDKDTPPTT